MRIVTPLSWMLAGLAVCCGLWYTLYHAWVCDDAFISYRYAEHLANGAGLVYNVGERVEGYTNFLWVVLLAMGLRFDIEPILFSQYLGVVFYVATIGLLWWTAARSNSVPLAGIGLALHAHVAQFATCGLETSMFTFFVTAGLVMLVMGEQTRYFAASGMALILATMTRPDGAVFYACAGVIVFVLARRSRNWRVLIGFAAPFLVVYLPYFIWKWNYYGYPLPNTFYAKSASRPFVDQGLYYIWLYLSCYWYLVPALVIPAWMVWRSRGTVGVSGFLGRRAPVVVAMFTLPFLAYVAWVGGDFMFSRFCLPITPALFLGLQFLAHGRRAWLAIAGVVVASMLTHFVVYPNYTSARIKPGNPRNVVEERVHYPGWYVDAYRILGRRLGGIQPGLRIAVSGGQAMLGYFGRFSYVLEIHGLTDEFIAHQPLSKRGRVGHEKSLPLDHPYFGEKKVHIIVGAFEQIAVPNDRLAELRAFEFWTENVPFIPDGQPLTGYAQATMLIYDAKIMTPLIGVPGLRFTPFPEHLDSYFPKMEQLGKEVVRRDLAGFRAYYFDHNADPDRLSRITTFLGRSP